MVTYNLNKQKATTRDRNGKIQSIRPIYDVEGEVVIKVQELINNLKEIALKFPMVKFHSELSAVPEKDFKIIREDLDYSNANFTDHGKKIFYGVTPNCVIILHQEV